MTYFRLTCVAAAAVLLVACGGSDDPSRGALIDPPATLTTLTVTQTDPAPARSRQPDVPVLGRARGDVVLAGLPGAVDDLPVEEVEVPADEVADAPVVVREAEEAPEEAVDRARALRPGRALEDARHERRAGQAAVDDLEAEDDLHAHPGLLEAALDRAGLLAAFAGVPAEGLDGGTPGAPGDALARS